MIVWLEIETWVIGKGGTRREERKRGGSGKSYEGCWVLWPLCVFGCISAVVEEGACVATPECWGVSGWYSRLVSRW
jgi:hypothetical protein